MLDQNFVEVVSKRAIVVRSIVVGKEMALRFAQAFSKWWLEPIYGSIMLKIFVCHVFNQVASIFHLGGGK